MFEFIFQIFSGQMSQHATFQERARKIDVGVDERHLGIMAITTSRAVCTGVYRIAANQFNHRKGILKVLLSIPIPWVR